MDISDSTIRCCVLIRGTRSSTTTEMINNYCEKFGPINYIRCAFSRQGIMRGYNVIFKQEYSVNRFMDDRPHHIDGQSIKVKRCISSNEEWRLTNQILLTTTDHLNDKYIFQEEILRGYFSRYGTIRTCHIDIYHNRPCAYLTFTDYDRVDQLINDKPHIINKTIINIRKFVCTDKQTIQNSSIKRRDRSSTKIEHQRNKKQRTSRIVSPKINPQDQADLMSEDNDIIHDVERLLSPSMQTNSNEILHLKNEYEHLNNQIHTIEYENHDNNHQMNDILNKLRNDVEILLDKIKKIQEKYPCQSKTFNDELFEKYTIDYVLSLNESDLQQRFEQLEKENQLLLLIKQNMPKEKLTNNQSV